jgi:hypothetical protein
MTKEQLIGMISEGYNLNQIASIHMINKAYLEMLLTEEATTVSPTGASGKTTTTTIKTTSVSSTEGTSGGSGHGESTTSGWQSEEGL